MALAPLADVADLPTGTSGETATALAVASAAVREAAGVPISVHTATVRTTAPQGHLLTLPGPISSVSSVSLDGTTLTDYEWLPNGLWRRSGWGHEPVPVTVTYTFGLAEVPDDVKDLTVQLALAWLSHMSDGGGSVAGLKNVRLDDAAEGYTDEGAGQVSPVFIPEITRQHLRSRFSGGVSVVEFL